MCGGGGAWEKGFVFIIMHGPSRMTKYPCIPAYNAGTEHVGFSPTRQTLLALSAKRRKVLGESYEGWAASY